MKSGPTLKGWTIKQRRRRAAITPTDTDVLPTPLWVPATTSAFIVRLPAVLRADPRGRLGVWLREGLGMNNASQDLEPIDQPGSGAREVSLGVGGEHPSLPGGGSADQLWM